jgi:hypothetical protein
MARHGDVKNFPSGDEFGGKKAQKCAGNDFQR